MEASLEGEAVMLTHSRIFGAPTSSKSREDMQGDRLYQDVQADTTGQESNPVRAVGEWISDICIKLSSWSQGALHSAQDMFSAVSGKVSGVARKVEEEVAGEMAENLVASAGNTNTTTSSTTTSTTTSTTSTTSTTETITTTSTVALWEVVLNGAVHVRAGPTLEAQIISIKWKCSSFHGKLLPDGEWVELYSNGTDGREVLGGGFVKLSDQGTTLVEQPLLQPDRQPCTECSDENYCTDIDWQVRHPGPARVYERMDKESSVLAVRWKCEAVRGVRMNG